MIKALFEHNPDGVLLIDAAGKITMNAAGLRIWGSEALPDIATIQDVPAAFQAFREDTVTPLTQEEDPVVRAVLKRENVTDVIIYGVANRESGIFLSVSARPLPDGGAMAVFRDITESRRLSQELQQRNGELAAREQENRELIARLRGAVDELSTPVLEIWDDVLALPVVGIVDTQRSAAMTDRLLDEVVRTRSRSVIIDLTGVELIDTSTADRFLRLARSVQLLGAQCLVTGIQPAVAQTLVDLGIEFGNLGTYRNLKSALESCIRRDMAERRAHVAR
jgi:rsbT co-antagonist protein RsbR